ncbi:Phospholipase A2 inhibitor CNF [Trichinella spiralis]|uniref:Phospholipase A2 inhibitor CNF n=1 Tax=Trichinella spiralis TaxID=6334 RepID=A0ABR3KBM9_TRISP
MSWEFCSILLDKYFEQKRPPDNKCGKGTTPSNRADWQYWTLFNNAFQAPLRQLFSLAKLAYLTFDVGKLNIVEKVKANVAFSF